MDAASLLTELQGLPWYGRQMVCRRDIPAREASYGNLDPPLDPGLRETLAASGVEGLYTHQVEAIDLLRRGVNVIVATPSASGKSLCYHLPVLESLLEDSAARALYLFPTKALAQDQSGALDNLIPDAARLIHGIFDGDTPSSDRAAVRRGARIVITNPDMLHVGILPNHRRWYSLLRELRYVVLDEAHVYRGVFGSHVANVIRRLRRLCGRFGSEPRFVLCSATIANPGGHAQRLTGLPCEVVDGDGSPYGGKDFVLWNPPMNDNAKGKRKSSNTEAAMVSAELLRRKIRTMTFVRTRRLAEVIHVYVRDRLRELRSSVADRIAPYRASYLPEDRRGIERDLFEGRLLGLVTTNAMELGVDVGELDATVLTGYPGSIASAWQQAGRSGRGGQRSLSVLVATDNPLDQYLMRHPDAFFDKPHESARISLDNPYILKPHLLCAAYEAPLTEDDVDRFWPGLARQADELAERGFLRKRPGGWRLDAGIAYPAQDVGIRSTSTRSYTLVEKASGVVMETLDETSAFFQLHPGAIYLHKGSPYLVSDLDLEARTAYAARTEASYYTEVTDFAETRILDLYREKRAGATNAYLGEVTVSNSIVGFKRKAPFTEEVLSEEYLSLPPQSYDTVALWFDIPGPAVEHARRRRWDLAGGLHAMEHAAIGMLPLFALCDRNDIGGVSTLLHPDTGRPQVFIHDGYPGGVGIAEHGFEIIQQLWEATLELVSGCPCEAGCPGCVQSPKCGNNNQPLDKQVAVFLLREMLGN